MAIAYRAFAQDGAIDHSSSPNNTVTVAKPTGTVDNDIMIACLYVEDSASGALAGLTAPAGWTKLYDQYLSFTGRQFHAIVYWKRASGEGSNYTFSWTNTVWYQGLIISYSGCSTGAGVIDASAFGTATQTATCTTPDVTASGSDDMWLTFLFEYFAGTKTVPSSPAFTGRATTSTYQIGVAERTLSSSGATGTADWTITSSTQNAIACSLLLLSTSGATTTKANTTVIQPKAIPTQSRPSVICATLVSNTSSSNSATYQTTSYSPTPGNLLLAWSMFSDTVVPDTPTLSGNAQTWTLVNARTIGSTGKLCLHRSRSATTAVGTLQFTAANSYTGAGWCICELSNTYVASGTDGGSSAIIQVQTTVGTGVTSGTITLNSFGTNASWNIINAGWGLNALSPTMTPESGYTAVVDQGWSTPSTRISVQKKGIGGDITPSVSWTGSTTMGGIAVEIKADRSSHPRTVSSIIRSIFSVVRTITTSYISRALVTQIAGARSVRRLNYWIRRASVARPPTISLRGLANYIRRTLAQRPPTFSVKALRNIKRVISTVALPKFVISRLQYWKRDLAVQRPSVSAVSRLQQRLRRLQTIVLISPSVGRLRRLLRTVNSTLSVKAIVGKVSSVARAVRTAVLNAAQPRRVVSYVRKTVVIITDSFSVKRLASFLRRVNSQVGILARVNAARSAITRAVRTIIQVTAQPKRVVYYVRRVSAVIVSQPAVKRVAAFLRGATLKVDILPRVSRLAGAVARAAQTIVLSASRVNRVARYLRTIRINLTTTAVVKRIGSYSRAVQSRVSFLARVTATRIVGVVSRSALMIRSGTISVARRIWWIRKANVLVAPRPAVQRIARYLRRLTSNVVSRDTVVRLRGYVRYVATSLGRASSVKRIARYIRAVVVALPLVPTVQRLGVYVRRALTQTTRKFAISVLVNIGEPVLLRVETLLRESERFTSMANELAKFRVLLGEKIRYKV